MNLSQNGEDADSNSSNTLIPSNDISCLFLSHTHTHTHTHTQNTNTQIQTHSLTQTHIHIHACKNTHSHTHTHTHKTHTQWTAWTHPAPPTECASTESATAILAGAGPAARSWRPCVRISAPVTGPIRPKPGLAPATATGPGRTAPSVRTSPAILSVFVLATREDVCPCCCCFISRHEEFTASSWPLCWLTVGNWSLNCCVDVWSKACRFIQREAFHFFSFFFFLRATFLPAAHNYATVCQRVICYTHLFLSRGWKHCICQKIKHRMVLYLHCLAPCPDTLLLMISSYLADACAEFLQYYLLHILLCMEAARFRRFKCSR